MRAARIDMPGGPGVIEIRDVDDPRPGPGCVLVRVAYAALNPLDTHARAQRIDWMHPGFPFVPGFEYAGIVERCGEGVPDGIQGRRVAVNGSWGGCAELAVAPFDSLHFVPEPFDWKTAASYSTCAYTAWLLVHSALKLEPGQRLAVHSAAGAVGAMLIQIAKSVGAIVYALAGGADKLAFAKRFGADFTVDYTDPDWTAQLRELAGGDGMHAVVDGNAGADAQRNFDIVAPLGNIVFIGATAGLAPPIDVSTIIGKSCSVTGFVQYLHEAACGGSHVEAVAEGLSSGEWRVPVERIFALDDCAEAHRAFEARELTGRALISIGGEL